MERDGHRKGFRWMLRRAAFFAVAAVLVCVFVVWSRGGSIAALGYALVIAGLVFAVVALGSNGLIATSYTGTAVSTVAASHEAPADRQRFTGVMLLAALPLVLGGILIAVAGHRWG